MEIYNQNQISKGYRPQVAAWRLPTEPWAFVIGRDGRVAARFEGAFSAAELRAAVQRVL
jgi:glutathione peroxidase-family protein